MASVNDFPTKGKILSLQNGKVVFNPAETNYELHLNVTEAAGDYSIGVPVDAIIRIKGHKVWTVPSGGNFITPLFGPPKIIQGRVLHMEGQTVVLQAGPRVVIDLPAEDSAIDLACGPIRPGAILNVTAKNGAFSQLRENALLP